jgi:hypothetical protein
MLVVFELMLVLMFPMVSQSPPPLRTNPALSPVTIPPDNPQTSEKEALGRQLFFDPRLSADDTISCATCHDPTAAWANHNRVDSGIRGQQGSRISWRSWGRSRERCRQSIDRPRQPALSRSVADSHRRYRAYDASDSDA